MTTSIITITITITIVTLSVSVAVTAAIPELLHDEVLPLEDALVHYAVLLELHILQLKTPHLRGEEEEEEEGEGEKEEGEERQIEGR